MTDMTYSFKKDFEEICSDYGIKNLFTIKYDGSSKQTWIYYDNKLVYEIGDCYIHNVDDLLKAVIGGMAFAIHNIKEN